MRLRNPRRSPLTVDMPVEDFPLLETCPIFDTWIDGIVDPVEIVGQGSCFRTTFFALTKMDGRWTRVVVFKAVRPCTYKAGRLLEMLQQAQRATAGGLRLH